MWNYGWNCNSSNVKIHFHMRNHMASCAQILFYRSRIWHNIELWTLSWDFARYCPDWPLIFTFLLQIRSVFPQPLSLWHHYWVFRNRLICELKYSRLVIILSIIVYIYLVGEFLDNMKMMNHTNGSSHFKFESGMGILFHFFKLIYVKKDFIMIETLKDINSQARREGGWRQRGISSRAPSSKGAPNATTSLKISWYKTPLLKI